MGCILDACDEYIEGNDICPVCFTGRVNGKCPHCGSVKK